ncbi:MAG: radical SAM protein [Oligoflexales bacterium]|nr:radical SAM protein [Oligoflexales bacterium]
MKISISYPPVLSCKGVPLVTQNRQFQWFSDPTFIYPVVPASAATLLKKEGFEVIWDDAIAMAVPYDTWLSNTRKAASDIIVVEAKTPVIKSYWKTINQIKEALPGTRVVLMGDHVTAFPRESLENSMADYVITGGDYDFSLLSIARKIRSGGGGELEPGIYYRENGNIVNTGPFELKHDLDSLPMIDRDLTRWDLYAFKNGNFKRTPGTYIMSGRDCWWGRCSFCSWTTIYPKFRKRSVRSVIDEIGHLIERHGIREIMDDTGTFPVGPWLREFCNEMIERGYNRKISLDINMRLADSVDLDDMKLMKRAGFRLVLVGIESANDSTLMRINKGTTLDEIKKNLCNLKKAGLFPHITIMFGYPWESYEQSKNTLEFGKYLLRKNLAYTMQATIVIPYPGTPLFRQCRENGWLLTEDWDLYDMRGPVMNSEGCEKEIMNFAQELYRVSFHPEFLARKLLSIRDLDDLKYFMRAGKKVLGHIFDFKG